MLIRTRLFLLTAITSLILVPSAYADHNWHDQNWDNGPSYPDPWDTPTPTPAPTTPTTTTPGGTWDTNQGDPQETPQIWNPDVTGPDISAAIK